MFGRLFLLTFILTNVAFSQCEIHLPEKIFINKMQKKSILNFKSIEHKNCYQGQLTYFTNVIKSFDGKVPVIKLNELLKNKKIITSANAQTISIQSISAIIEKLLKKSGRISKNIEPPASILFLPGSTHLSLDEGLNKLIINGSRYPITYEFKREVLIASEHIRPYTKLTPGILVKKNVWIKNNVKVNSLKNINDHFDYFIISSNIKKGEIIQPHHIKKRKLVSYGSKVQLVLNKKNLFLQIQGVTEGQAGINESVTVRLPSGKRVSGKVKSEDIVHASI